MSTGAFRDSAAPQQTTMSYLARHHSSLGGLETVVSAAKAVGEDPCLMRVASLVVELQRLEAAPPRPAGAPPAPAAKGIGLCQAVKPLEAMLWIRRRPWAVPLGAAALVGGLLAAGYLAGSGATRGRR